MVSNENFKVSNKTPSAEIIKEKCCFSRFKYQNEVKYSVLLLKIH